LKGKGQYDMFDPNEHRAQCETYLSRFLQSRVNFLQAEMLPKSTRDAPWRLDIEVNGSVKSFVLRLDTKDSEREYQILRAMETIPIPTPRVYGWDPAGEALEVPCFFCDYIEGESLLKPMLAGEAWAEDLYLDTVCALQRITEDDLGESLSWLKRETAMDVLGNAHEYFQRNPHPLATSVYRELTERIPQFPEVRFSNGDLWLDNFLVRDQQLAGVIDFEGAGFSDPIYEFLLSFFVSPALLGRGIEERYCQRIGYDPAILRWYHGLEFFDTWRWVLKTGESFVHHTAESLEANLEQWLVGVQGS
jgi:aminoglycoside phosphotransferase (APT) family kinase protein